MQFTIDALIFFVGVLAGGVIMNGIRDAQEAYRGARIQLAQIRTYDYRIAANGFDLRDQARPPAPKQ